MEKHIKKFIVAILMTTTVAFAGLYIKDERALANMRTQAVSTQQNQTENKAAIADAKADFEADKKLLIQNVSGVYEYENTQAQMVKDMDLRPNGSCKITSFMVSQTGNRSPFAIQNSSWRLSDNGESLFIGSSSSPSVLAGVDLIDPNGIRWERVR